MPENLIAKVMNHLTPDLIARIAVVTGHDTATATRALRALVPGVLWSISRLAAEPGGVQRIVRALASPEDQMPEPAGSSTERTVYSGADILTPLLGSGRVTSLMIAIERYAGLGERQAQEFMTIIGPLVMGALTKAQVENGLSGRAVAGRLAQQSADAETAMPADFFRMLRATDVFRIPEPPATTTEAEADQSGAGQPYRAFERSGAVESQRVRSTAAMQRSTPAGWAWVASGLVAILALIWLAQWLVQKGEVADADASRPPPQAAAGVGQPAITVGLPLYGSDGVQLGQITGLVLAPDRSLRAVRADLATHLGIGEKVVMLNADQIQRSGDRAVLNLTSAEARKLPPVPTR